MLKKILLTIILLTQTAVFASFNDVLIADITYDWINKSEVEREAIIQEVKDIIFEQPVEKQKDFRSQFKDRLKDKNFLENYMAASAGYKEYKGNNISAFYFKKMKSLYMYALQDKKDVSKAYYYDALGHLKYVDLIYGEYPDYPYYSIQYRISGTPVSAIYYASKDCQYLFTPKGDFEGVWYKHNLYNNKSEIILKRTTY
ncbi:hypothetical protein EGQ24_04710 [bacterium]|nr:hypothetical protein [bacterium]